MPWTPEETVIHARAIPDNLFAYFAANQADAFTWAGDSSLKPVKKFSNSVADRTKPVYPSMAFVDDNDAADYAASTATQGVYRVTFELSIQNQNADTAVSQARTYAKAFLSMVLNCPKATYAANTGALATASSVDLVECAFDPIRTNDKQNDFLQVFQIRVTYLLQAGN